MKKKISIIFFIALFVALPMFLNFKIAKAAGLDTNYNCLVYFTGVGCPHCAKTDPVIFEKLLPEEKNLVVLEYEIYQSQNNAPLLDSYCQNYKLPYCLPQKLPCCGIPLAIFSQGNILTGDKPILTNIRQKIKNTSYNNCSLANGTSISLEDLNLTSLAGYPKVWYQNRILIKQGNRGNNQILKKLLLTDNIARTLKSISYQTVKPKPVALSGRFVKFNNAIKVDDWLLEWNKEGINLPAQKPSRVNNQSADLSTTNSKVKANPLTFSKIALLAFVDSINPCALAVLLLMLITIAAYNNKDKKNLLLSGLSFVLAVFLIYLVYGVFIIKFLQVVQKLTIIRLYLYKSLGGLAVLLGLLNIRDFIKYRPGAVGTEMPLFLRPKVKRIISGIVSPKGAFLIGSFVTIFLLPCTVGPYVIAGGILSFFKFLQTLPWLVFYNFIFVLPMLLIVFLVYFGVEKIEEVSRWKDRNIRRIHLAAGIIMVFLGIVIMFGLM